MNITLIEDGARLYLAGNTFPLKEVIKAAGGHWDGDRKMWWVGKVKRSLIEQSIDKSASPQPAIGAKRIPGMSATVSGRVEYKGKIFYLAGKILRGRTHWDDGVAPIETKDGSKFLLYARDGTFEFWAARNVVTVTKQYSKPQTIQGLANFAADRKAGIPSRADHHAMVEALDDQDCFQAAAAYAREHHIAY